MPSKTLVSNTSSHNSTNAVVFQKIEQTLNTALYLFFIASTSFYMLYLPETRDLLTTEMYPIEAKAGVVTHFNIGAPTKVAFFLFSYVMYSNFWLSFLISLFLWSRVSNKKSFDLSLLNKVYSIAILALIVQLFIYTASTLTYKMCSGDPSVDPVECTQGGRKPLTKDQYVALHIVGIVGNVWTTLIVFPVYVLSHTIVWERTCSRVRSYMTPAA